MPLFINMRRRKIWGMHQFEGRAVATEIIRILQEGAFTKTAHKAAKG